MRIIAIQHNPFTNQDFAVYLKDNHSNEGIVTPAVNTDAITCTKSGMPMLQIEFWRNERFRELLWQGESISYVEDDDSDFVKRGRPWSEFLNVYESW